MQRRRISGAAAGVISGILAASCNVGMAMRRQRRGWRRPGGGSMRAAYRMQQPGRVMAAARHALGAKSGVSLWQLWRHRSAAA